MGPLFYIIFINDMLDLITIARPFAYADDTKLLMVMENSFNSVLLQEDLDEVALWSPLWDLSLNPNKSYHVHYHFSSILCNNEYFINMDHVSSIYQIKDLGIMFSSDLQWNLHYKNIISKAYMFYTLRRTFTCPSPIARKRLYSYILHPIYIWYIAHHCGGHT